MKSLILALLLVGFASAAFKMKHSQLNGLERTFKNLDKSLLNQIANAKYLIKKARLHRNTKHAARRRALLKQRRATGLRIQAEANYNAKKQEEETAIAHFKLAHKLYLAAKSAYKKAHKDQSKRIKDLDYERSVIEKIRRLLGLNHSKNWKSYKKDKGVKYIAKSHEKYKHDKSTYNAKHGRFVRHLFKGKKKCTKSYYDNVTHKCEGYNCCTSTYWRLSGGGKRLHSTQCKWERKKCTPKGRDSVIVGTGDNSIHVYLNGRYLGKQQGTQRDWTKSTRWEAKLKKNDVLQVYAENYGAYSVLNPGAIKLQIQYGKNMFYTNTNQWRCQPHRDGFQKYKAKDVKSVRRARQQTYSYPHVAGISSAAKWIWDADFRTRRVDCFFVVPY